MEVAAAKGLNLTLSELETYSGAESGKPILISVLGVVYDVGGRAGVGMYGKGAPYNQFAGRGGGLSYTHLSFTLAAWGGIPPLFSST